jgi:hypothetical protein
VFIFDTENGTIDGWNPAVGAKGSTPSTVTEVAHNRGAKAVYKGLAIAQASGKTYLYATNFRSGRVEAYNGHFKRVSLPGGRFVDPQLPAGYGPFGIAEIGGELYVTFAQRDAMRHDDVAGPGHGFVDVFSNDGAFVRRLVTRGALDSPWGLALAPAGFGQFSGDLLVGNFGNGHINVYSPATGAHLGQLRRANGRPIVIDGLWGLQFGNGNAAQTNQLIFSAGPDGKPTACSERSWPSADNGMSAGGPLGAQHSIGRATSPRPARQPGPPRDLPRHALARVNHPGFPSPDPGERFNPEARVENARTCIVSMSGRRAVPGCPFTTRADIVELAANDAGRCIVLG